MIEQSKQDAYPRKDIIDYSTTVPPKVISLKFKPSPSTSVDDDLMNFEFINLSFAYQKQDIEASSPASQFFIKIVDIDTGATKNYIQYAFDTPYMYWQRTAERHEDDYDNEPENGIVNARVTITPINGYGQGNRSTFLMPMKNLHFVTENTMTNHQATQVLAKYWDYYSMTPEEVYNRPKQMHIYIDVPNEDILLDKKLLYEQTYRYNMIGDYEETNREMFRWVIQDENIFTRLNADDDFIPMQVEEISFITYLIQSINDIYRRHLNNQTSNGSEPTVFKVAVLNPRDHDDSIIIYIMKGQRWQM